jgi:phytoene dehydrogenase-like protein
LHHNVFFSADYKHEFKQLFADRIPPDDPTVYLNAQDRMSSRPPGGAERMFFLSNAPALANGARTDWSRESESARERIINVLARHGWRIAAQSERAITPADLEREFPASRGSIYGLSSNSMMAAFKRPQNKIPGVRNLYLAGGSVHPGAGLPMVALSAKIATQLALQETR